MSKQPTVADYIVGRLAREGITDCFGVAGDFAFKLNDAVVRSERIRWIGCSNELDAAYAADGYARMRGCSMLMTTYAVGELSALNGVMGAKAERSCVFHLVGMPTMRNQRVGKIIHHTLGDGIFQNFANISAQAACVSAVITPDNCAHEMERVIATARAESRPAYILVAGDFAVTPVTAGDAPKLLKPINLAVNTKADISTGAKVLTYVGVDDFVFGQRQGDLVAKAVGENGKIAYILGKLGTSAQLDREAGLMDTLKKHPGIVVVEKQAADWDNSKALAITQDFLSKYPQGAINAIVDQGPEGVNGANFAIPALINTASSRTP